MKKFILPTILAMFLVLSLAFTVPLSVTTASWTELDDVEGGFGGLYTIFTNFDSSADNYTAWTTKHSRWDGGTVSMSYYFNAAATDSIKVIPQIKMGDNLIVDADTQLVIGASSPVAGAKTLTFSAYGRQMRLKIHNQADSGANFVGNDLEIGLYSPTNDVINEKKNHTDKWSSGSQAEKMLKPLPIEPIY